MLNDAVNDGVSDGQNDGERRTFNPSFLSLNTVSNFRHFLAFVAEL